MSAVTPRQVTVLAGPTFMLSDVRGDVTGDPANLDGLFHRDMRHLSQWALRLNGRPLTALAAVEVDSDHAVLYVQEPTGTVHLNPTLSIVRRRHVDTALRETLEVTNHHTEPVRLGLTLSFDADFADIFEVKDKLGKGGTFYRRLAEDRVVLGYKRGNFRRETEIQAGEGFYTAESVEFRIELEPAQTWRRDVTATFETGLVPARSADAGDGLSRWLEAAPRVDSDSEDLRRLYRQSLVDLAALRFRPDKNIDAYVPAAGLPWFMALFGRDSLITSYQAIPYAPELARATLHALAVTQSRDFDDFRDAEPGKILHELRHGELTHFRERPHSPYYGSADSTMLFLIVLDEYARWTGDTATVRELEPHARAALAWLEDSADLDDDGFVEYQTRNAKTGLVNQGWKDSWNSVLHPDGRLAARPHALCELQGYAYDARLRSARLAREVWDDPVLADRLELEATDLQRRFDEAFWLAEEGFYALALDGDKAPVRTLTSNIGHLLWSGIVPEERADHVTERLMSEAMFSGWGVRTLATGQPAYNPMGYHNGTVWPHDNAIIAAGLARYGRREEAARIAQALFDAGPHLGHRLPEALVGTARTDVGIPVPYPSACSPQAWASGASLLLLTVVLGLDVGADGLVVDPYLPASVGELALRSVHTPAGPTDTGRATRRAGPPPPGAGQGD